jgi:alginate O-acetyltransferase complex protein AlgI
MFAYDHTLITSPEILVGLLAFALQIYGDFAGYSKIARGLAKFFGIELMRNFRQPYFATNPAEFWRRWHISLSTWLRDYLYIPLGGNRHGQGMMFRNLFLTMVLGGLWHGASWTFIVWGVYQGLLLILHRVYRLWRKEPARQNFIGQGLSILGTFCATLYGWLIFRSNDLEQLVQFTLKLCGPLQLPSDSTRAFFLSIIPVWLIIFYVINLFMDGIQEYRQTDILLRFERWWDYLVAAIVVFLIVMFGGQSDAFIYFQF